MTDEIKHVLDPNCPWYPLKKLRLPNVKWCEQQVCSWVEEPANTWSNLMFFVVAAIMHRANRSARSRAIRFYPVAAILIGATSLIYHASNTFALQIFDFLAMYIMCYLVILINFDRLGRHSFEKSFSKYWMLVIGTTVLTVAADWTPFPIQGLVLLLILGACFSEGVVRRKVGRVYSLKYFWLTAALFGVAAVFSWLDHTRVLCDPTNHVFQGHALWHVLSALGLLTSWMHHRQFDDLLARSSNPS